MEVRISNSDDGKLATVTKGGQVKVQSESLDLPFYISSTQEGVFQFVAEATVINGTATVWHLQNTDNTKLLVMAEMDAQVVDAAGGTAIPSASTYFEVGFNRTYSSGGTVTTPVNQNRTSGSVASAVLYDNAPTLAGTFLQSQKWFPAAEAERRTFEERDGCILGLNDTMEMRITSDHTSGTALSHCTFMLIDPDTL